MKEYTLKDLINLFLSKLFTIITVSLVFGVAAFCVAYWALPRMYSSHLSMYVQSYTAGIDVSDSELRGSVSTSKQLLNTYIEVLKDDAVMADVGEQLLKNFKEDGLKECFTMTEDGKVSASSLRSCIKITAVTDTTALTVSVTTRNAEVSAAVCNYLSRVAQKYLDKAVGVGSISYIANARIYETPVSPNIPKITLLGAAIGLILIMLEILVIDFFDNSIKSSQEITEKYEKAILGEIQSIGGGVGDKKSKKKKNTDRSRNLLTDKNIPFNVTESYKSIRTNIIFSLSTQKKKVFAVSSANPGEGKSTTAANIAIAFAQMENRVLLIDGDMRKPVQHKVFKVSNIDGLSTLISKMSTVEDAVKRNVLPNLDVLPAGTCPPNPSELLASEQFAELVDKLAVHYDYVIIDTPPVNVVSDAIVLRDVIGGILFVLRYGSTTFDDLDEAMKKVEIAEANTIGFILNDVKLEHRGGYYARDKYSYYKYGYSNGYGYRRKTDENNKKAID